MKSFEQFAQAAWEAHRQELIKGQPEAILLTWDMLAPCVRARWIVVAKTIAGEIAALH